MLFEKGRGEWTGLKGIWGELVKYTVCIYRNNLMKPPYTTDVC
jgi:hypothetical protein